MRAALLFALALAGCSPSQLDLHAGASHVAHGVLHTAGETINEECPPLIEREGPDVHVACRTAGEAQRAAVTAWGLWASTTLAAVRGEDFDVGLALDAARRVLRLYLDAQTALVGTLDLPDPPRLLLTLTGASADE